MVVGGFRMGEKEFFKRLKEEDYEELEKELTSEYRTKKNLKAKYFLGICYSCQIDKYDEAVIIFKSLLNTKYKCPNMYLFLSIQNKSNLESLKILNEGLKFFPDNENLKKQRLFYLDSDEKEKYFDKLKDEVDVTFDMIMEMLGYFYKNEKVNKYRELIKYLDKLDDKLSVKFLKIVISYLSDKEIDNEMFDSFVIADNDTYFGLIVRLMEIDIERNKDKVLELVRELNYEVDVDSSELEICFRNKGLFYFDVDEFFFSLLHKICGKYDDEFITRKLYLIEFFRKKLYHIDDKKILTKTNLRKVEKLILTELKTFEVKSLYSNLIDIYYNLEDNKKYFKSYVMFTNKFNETKFFILYQFSEGDLNYACNYLIENVRIFEFNKDVYQDLIKGLVKELFGCKKYADIVKLLESIYYKNLDYLEFGFEVAYSFGEVNRKREAKDIYLEYIKKYPNANAAINNLGVMYEEEGDYVHALEYYEKALEIIYNDIYANNIKRCKKLINDKKKEVEVEKKALEYLDGENVWFIDRLKLFYGEADEDDNVICSYKMLPAILRCNVTKAQDVLNQMLEKGYIFKNKKHDYDTVSNVYRINFSIKKRLIEIEKENKLIASFVSNFDDLSLERLSEIGYGEAIKRLNMVSKEDIRDIFVRDYHELVFNYLTNQKKSVILMSGSLVELLLLFILDKNKIAKYNVGANKRMKKVIEMDISEMLEVCDKENLIQNTPKKFIDGIKTFRNFIHPGKELRENILKIDKVTVELAFNIVNWLILNVDLG